MYNVSNIEWKRIAEQITKETDPAKLALLVKELCAALDGVHKRTESAEQSA